MRKDTSQAERITIHIKCLHAGGTNNIKADNKANNHSTHRALYTPNGTALIAGISSMNCMMACTRDGYYPKVTSSSDKNQTFAVLCPAVIIQYLLHTGSKLP